MEDGGLGPHGSAGLSPTRRCQRRGSHALHGSPRLRNEDVLLHVAHALRSHPLQAPPAPTTQTTGSSPQRHTCATRPSGSLSETVPPGPHREQHPTMLCPGRSSPLMLPAHPDVGSLSPSYLQDPGQCPVPELPYPVRGTGMLAIRDPGE